MMSTASLTGNFTSGRRSQAASTRRRRPSDVRARAGGREPELRPDRFAVEGTRYRRTPPESGAPPSAELSPSVVASGVSARSSCGLPIA